MILDLPAFEPRFPWWGGDLQTLRDIVLFSMGRLSTSLAPCRSERRQFDLRDGSGDALLGMLDIPQGWEKGKPLVLLIHGAPGSEDSLYLISMARTMMERGHRVLRLNLRGAGPSRATCRQQYSAGSSADLGWLFEAMPKELTEEGVVAVGYSVGGAVLLKHLGEAGPNTPLKAAASVSAPIDLRGTCWTLMQRRNAFYHRVALLAPMRKEATAAIAQLTSTERTNIENAKSLMEYDDGFTAARNGCTSALDYYACCSAIGALRDIRIPTLCLAALDDPWVPGSTYAGYDWGANPYLTPLLTRSGGHVGFHGVGRLEPWRDLAVATFLEKVLASEETRCERRRAAAPVRGRL